MTKHDFDISVYKYPDSGMILKLTTRGKDAAINLRCDEFPFFLHINDKTIGPFMIGSKDNIVKTGKYFGGDLTKIFEHGQCFEFESFDVCEYMNNTIFNLKEV